MKYLIILFCLISCSPKQNTSTSVIHDTVYIEAPSENTSSIEASLKDTVYIHSEKKYDSIYALLKKKNDTLLNERYKIERVRYYSKIVQRNKTQTKFLLGWILRAIKD